MLRGVASILLFLALAGVADAAVIRGGARADGIVAQDGTRQTVICGRGRDIVSADRSDRVGRDCETVSRELARDPLSGGPAQHATIVEPDTASFGRTVVAVYQVGRIRDGAAMQIGWATSRDAGQTWQNGNLPGLTIFSTPAGTAMRVSDPVIAYDQAHGVWLAASLTVSPGLTQLLISRSADGISWELPVIAVQTTLANLGYDKEWLTCDNGSASSFRGRCYLSYTDFDFDALSTQYSADGGLTWSAPVQAAPAFGIRIVGVQPAALPNGTLTILFVGQERFSGMWSVRSRDGGASYEGPVQVADLTFARSRVLRDFPLPSAESAGGDVYAVWTDCRFRPVCDGNDLVLSRTSDGARWTPLRRIPLPRTRSYAIPGLGVSPGGRLALVYYTQPNGCASEECALHVGFTTSRGTSWTRPRRLSPQGIRLSWIARTTLGRMVGDYISTSWTDGRPVSVFVLAKPLRNGAFRESVFAFRG